MSVLFQSNMQDKMTQSHLQQNIILTQQEAIKELKQREEVMCQVSRTQALMAVDTQSRLRAIIDTQEGRIKELEAKEGEWREAVEDERLFALDREEHLKELLQDQSEELNDVTEALHLAREELAEKKVAIATLERQMTHERVDSFIEQVHEAMKNSWAPKKPAPIRRPLKRVRQPQLPTRQSLRLQEKRMKMAADTTDAPGYSPASPSPSQQCGSEPDIFFGYVSSPERPLRPDSPVVYVVSDTDEDEDECPQPPPSPMHPDN